MQIKTILRLILNQSGWPKSVKGRESNDALKSQGGADFCCDLASLFTRIPIGTKQPRVEHLLPSLLWTPSVLSQAIPISKCHLPILRHTFYLEHLVAVPMRTLGDFLPGNAQMAHSPMNRKERETKDKTLIQQREDQISAPGTIY